MIIALKGTMGTGKSTLAVELAKQGYEVVNCDQIVHRLYEEDEQLIEKINTTFDLKKKKLFSLKKNKQTVDRKKLGKIVFNNQAELKKLEAIVHPMLKTEMEQIINSHEKVVIDCQVVDKLALHYDLAILLQADEKTIIERIKNRDQKDEELIKKIMLEQKTDKIKLSTRTYVIDSTPGIEHMLAEVDKIKELKHD